MSVAEFNGEVHEFSMNTAYLTVTPKEYYFVSKDEAEMLWWMEYLPRRIKEELSKMGGGIIWWRAKPEMDHAKIGWDGFVEGKRASEMTDEEKELAEQYFCWKGYMRLATSPELPEEIVTTLTDSYEMFREKCKEFRRNAIKNVETA